MKTFMLTRALQASLICLFTTNVYAQSATTTALDLKPIQTLACYKSADPLVEFQEYDYQTSGWCQQQCGGLDKPVMAITAGSTCYCGDEIPALDQQVSNSSCNSICNGFGSQTCGGIGFWQVYLTGLTTNVETAPNTTSSSTSSSISSQPPTSTSVQPSVVTRPGETVVVTAPASSSSSTEPNKNSGGGTNKVGIAVGVVVGVLAVAAIVGGVIFFLKQRRRKAIEEEHKRNAAASQFAAANRSETKSNTDQRLDPSVFSHRRESIGSIADERDFSRRILQVRNPDRASQHSTMA